MTATVVKQNLDFVGNPTNKSPLLGLFMPIGATVTANNSTRTVVVTTRRRNPFMLQGLALVQIVCSKGLADRSLLDHGTDGTGPYRLTRRGPRRPLHLPGAEGLHVGPRRRHDRRDGLPAKVTSRSSRTRRRRRTSCSPAALNVATIAGPDRARLNKANLFTKVTVGRSRTSSSSTRTRGIPAPTPAVRKALVQALNLGQIGTVVTSGRGAAR